MIEAKTSYLPARRVFFLGTYAPRRCGIATYTQDLATAVADVLGQPSVGVLALTDSAEGYDYPPEVVFELRQHRVRDYRLAADFVNYSDARLVSLQHEFNIFGGPAGGYLHQFLGNLKKPVVTTLHTVFEEEPRPGLRDSLARVIELSDALVVMNPVAVPMLERAFGVTADRISVIPHGIPDVPFVDPNFYKDQFDVEGRFVLLTFGLLGPNKGIETVLEALPEVVARHPNVVYIVLGATHPAVKKRDGEAYRLALQRRVERLGLDRHVMFVNRFVSLEKLCEFVGACDLYVVPYPERQQITSGTLAYAVGMGKAVISTPFWHAEQLLAEDRGRLVPFEDPTALGRAIIELIEQEAERHQMRKRAYAFSRQTVWKEVAREYSRLFQEVLEAAPTARVRAGRAVLVPQNALPEARLDHLLRLSDDTGIIRHSSFGIPNRHSGYCTEDAASTMVVALMHHSQFQEEAPLVLAETSLSFLNHAQLPDGRFRRLMGFDRRFDERAGRDVTQGRTLWALGYAVGMGHTDAFQVLARELFERAEGALELDSPFAVACALKGFFYFVQRYPGATGARRRITELADRLCSCFESASDASWRWFGESVQQGAARLPQGLLRAHQITGTQQYRDVALDALAFLTEQLDAGEFFDLPGTEGELTREGGRPLFTQLPLDAGCLVEAYLTALEVTGERPFLELAHRAFRWFLGDNRLGAPLYDFGTSACFDGLDPDGVNRNQGAEAILSFLIALLNLWRHELLPSLPERLGQISSCEEHDEPTLASERC